MGCALKSIISTSWERRAPARQSMHYGGWVGATKPINSTDRALFPRFQVALGNAHAARSCALKPLVSPFGKGGWGDLSIKTMSFSKRSFSGRNLILRENPFSKKGRFLALLLQNFCSASRNTVSALRILGVRPLAAAFIRASSLASLKTGSKPHKRRENILTAGIAERPRRICSGAACCA